MSENVIQSCGCVFCDIGVPVQFGPIHDSGGSGQHRRMVCMASPSPAPGVAEEMADDALGCPSCGTSDFAKHFPGCAIVKDHLAALAHTEEMKELINLAQRRAQMWDDRARYTDKSYELRVVKALTAALARPASPGVGEYERGIRDAAKIAKQYFVGMFTGWKGHTGDSKITLDEAEDVASECGPICEQAILALLASEGSRILVNRDEGAAE